MIVSASTNPPSVSQLDDYLEELSLLDVDFIHCDIMDGDFVSATTFDYTLLPHIFDKSSKGLDVHVMAKNIDKNYNKYFQKGVKILTIHYESVADKDIIKDIILDIKSHGILAGLAIKPQTTLSEVTPLLNFLDVLLIMSVEPGKSYQKFLETTFDKLKDFASFRKKNHLQFKIEIDGGVNDKNVKFLKANGADIVVVGGYLYSNQDRKNAVATLKR